MVIIKMQQHQHATEELDAAIYVWWPEYARDDAKELEMKLATTLYDIDTLKNEFKFVKKTGKRLLRRGGQSIEHIEED